MEVAPDVPTRKEVRLREYRRNRDRKRKPLKEARKKVKKKLAQILCTPIVIDLYLLVDSTLKCNNDRHSIVVYVLKRNIN